MPLSIVYRRGSLEDLSRLHISEGLSASAQSIEFNVLGMGHEFWVAVEEGMIIGLTVLSRSSMKELMIVYLEVAPSHKSQGVGTGLIQAILDHYPQSEFSVIPFDGTEEFYKRLGFELAKNWEMRKRGSHKSVK
jgi:N-acetylglutamate synthase-like GNAT family acetyltransferase